MATSGGTPLATAFVEVRADTSYLRGDIRDGLRGTGPDGRRAGGDLGNGLREGTREGTRRIEGDLTEQMRRSADRAGGEGGRRLGSSMSSALVGGLAGGLAGVAAAAGIDGLVGSLGGLISDARESARVGALTEQTIKTMGNQANISADGVGALAESISNMTGADDEMIQSGANLLLTFGNIRNEVGAGNDIFNQATQAALDMSTTLGTDMNGAAIQLGKALNDPVKGLTALSKSGVSFSESQKDMVKSMVASGDTLGAQKLILAELEKQFGGSTAAVATNGQRLETVFGNLREQIGGYLLPAMESVQGFIAEKVIPTVSTFLDEWANSEGLGGGVRAFFGGIGDGARAAFDALEPVTDGARLLGAALGTLISGDFTGGGIWEKLGIYEDSAVVGVIFGVRDAVVSVIDTVRGLGEDGGGGFASALGLSPEQVQAGVDAVLGLRDNVVEAVSGIVGSFTEFYASRNIGEYFTAAQEVIAGVVGWLQANVVPFLAEHMPQVVAILGDAFTAAGTVIGFALDVARIAVGVFVDVVSFIWTHFGDSIVTIMRGAWEIVSGVISGAFDVIQGIFRLVTGILTGDWQKMGDALQQIGRGAMDAVEAVFRGAFTILEGVFQAGVGAIGAIWDGIKEAAKAPVRFVVNTVLNDGLIGGINWITDKIGAESLHINPIQLPKGFDAGGYTGPGSKHQVAGIVHAGEVVFSQEDVAAHGGAAAVDAMRQMRGYASGGIVSFGRRIASEFGALVTEHPAFGGVDLGAHKGRGHREGRAIDVNTRPGTSAREQSELRPIVELAKQLGFWTLFMTKGHYNHAHIEDRGGATNTDSGGGIMGALSGLIDGLDPAQFLKDKVAGAFAGMPAAGMFGDALKQVPGYVIGAVVDKIKDSASGLMSVFTGDDSSDQATGSVVDQVRAVAAKYGWDQGSQWSSLQALIRKESSWDPSAANPTSSARGLFQKMTSIHGPVERTAAGQAEWGLDYIKDRYKTPNAAWAWHLKNNWYAGGTPSAVGGLSWVGERGPELVDFRGGERVYNASLSRRMEEAAVSKAGASGAAPLVGTVNLTSGSDSSVRDQMQQLHHELKLIDRGGAYSRRRGGRS